ncbi:MAG: type II CAAX endopeptidase family protein [Candidatus Nanopelagicales bacterium]
MGERLQIDIVRSPLVQAAGIAMRLTRWWATYPLALGIVIVSALLISPVAPLLEDEGFPLSVLTLVLLHVLVLALLFAWIKWWERRPTASVGLTSPADRAGVVRGFGLGLALFAVPTLILVVVGAVHATPTASGPVAWSALGPALVMLPVWLFLAMVQEALTRGFVLQVSGLQVTAWAAIVGQAVLWAVIRLSSQASGDLMALLNLVLVGVALAFVALRSGSLWLAIGIDAGWSWFETSILGVNWVGAGRTESVVTLVPTSASWFSGGAAGVLASPVVTVAAAAAVVWTFRRARSTLG